MPIKDQLAPLSGASRIDLAETPDFEIGQLRVSPARCQVEANGERREIQPKVAQVLVALAAARSEVVSRDRLIELCWDGRIVGDDVLNRCILALRHLAKDYDPAPFTIETIPRVGYSLVEHAGASQEGRRLGSRNARKAGLGGLVVIALAAAAALVVESNRATADQPASIAVRSFRNLSSGDPYFAEGIGEEIIGQLSREPQFRVAGSSSGDLRDADVKDIAKALDVDYVLEGSVRTQGDQVRVNADLVRARDGIRLWTDSYDGKLDDIFAIQRQIGSAIAVSLRRKLVKVPATTGPMVTKGEAYNLYLTARGLLRTRNRQVGRTAVGLLREAINQDPRYAPAWAALASAIELEGAQAGPEGLIAARKQAQQAALHALQLAPDLSKAHLELGLFAEFGGPEFQSHVRRAAALEPNDAENLIWLGVADAAAGRFDDELADYRAAQKADPLWFRTTGALAIGTAEMGRRASAEAIAKRGLPRDESNRHILLGRIASIVGDYSEAVRQWSIVVRSKSPRWSDTANRNVQETLYVLGLPAKLAPQIPRAPDMRHRGHVLIASAPSAAEWRAHNRDRFAAVAYRTDNYAGAKLMLRAGRVQELLSTLDSDVGLLSIRAGEQLRPDQLPEVPFVILVLRSANRGAEAARLQAQALRLLRAIDARGAVPVWFDADSAALLAVAGQREAALDRLERALRGGWTHSGSTDLGDLAAEPVFATLRGDPRFGRVRAALIAHLAKERAETRRLRL